MGDTFADGSCVACRENDELTQCGWAVVTMLSAPSNSEMDRAENPDIDGPRCSCRIGQNPHHKCVKQCVEINGCNEKCSTKRHDQKRPHAPVATALWGVLPGFEQSTPRAELYAIYQAVKHGSSPQRIFCDHINHVNALNDWMLSGVTSFLHPKTPNVDLWRKVYHEVNRRGGLCQSGSRQLCFIWQPSHTRATDTESTEEKFLRRGNDAADLFANKGRLLHVDISETVRTTKALFDKAKAWAMWLGHASYLQYAKEWSGCDHDVKPKGSMAKPKNQKQEVKVPPEAKVIRRLPWARSSLGTIEYLEDLWVQDSSPSQGDQFSDQFSIVDTVREHGTLAERAYLDKFNNTVQGGEQHRGVRYIPRQFVPEMSEVLPTNASLGHHMMTAGLKPRQFFWCELCSAYTGQRVRKLMHECDRINRSVPAVEALRKGLDPWNSSPLITRPRRLCKRDVGTHQWSGEGRPDDNAALFSDCALFSEVSDVAPSAAVSTLISQHAEEDDPLGLGFGLA